jgi:hypothetical protein
MTDAATLLAAVSVLTSTGGMAVSTLVYRRLRMLDNLADLHAKYHPDDAALVR